MIHIYIDKLHLIWEGAEEWGFERGTRAHLSWRTVPWGCSYPALQPWSRPRPEFWLLGMMLLSPCTSSSHHVCSVGQNEDSLGTDCWGTTVFSSVCYSGKSTNGQIAQSSEAEQEETEDNGFCSSVSLWVKVRCKKMEIACSCWRVGWPGITMDRWWLDFLFYSILKAKHKTQNNVSKNLRVFLYILYLLSHFGQLTPNSKKWLSRNPLSTQLQLKANCESQRKPSN